MRLAWEGLTPDLLVRARDRIRKFAWLLLVVMGGGSVFDSVFVFMIIGRFDPLWLGAAGATIVMSLGLVLVSRNKRIAHVTVLRLGLGYEVAICLILAYLMPQIVHSDTGSFPYVTWVEPLIILFP